MISRSQWWIIKALSTYEQECCSPVALEYAIATAYTSLKPDVEDEAAPSNNTLIYY
jgi:hypothetical protein